MSNFCIFSLKNDYFYKKTKKLLKIFSISNLFTKKLNFVYLFDNKYYLC